MRRRKVIIATLALVLCGVLAVVFWPEKPEPVYKGRKLSEWIVSISTSETGFSKEKVEAIQAIGTNGLPYYLEWIEYEQGFFKKTELETAEKIRQWIHVKWWPDQTKKHRAGGAWLALASLRERAEPAMPHFLGLATNHLTASWTSRMPDERVLVGFRGLASIGRPALPVLLTLMTNTDARIRTLAINQSGHFYGSSTLLRQLKQSLQDPDSAVRIAAASAMRTYEYDLADPVDKP